MPKIRELLTSEEYQELLKAARGTQLAPLESQNAVPLTRGRNFYGVDVREFPGVFDVDDREPESLEVLCKPIAVGKPGYLEQKIVAKLQPASWKDERAAYTRTRRKIAELELRKREGEVVEIETARAVVGEMLDRLRHGLLNIPGTWSPELIALGTTSQRKIAAKLTELRDELMTCLQNAFAEERKR